MRGPLQRGNALLDLREQAVRNVLGQHNLAPGGCHSEQLCTHSIPMQLKSMGRWFSGERVVVDPSGGGDAFENLGWGKKTGSLIDNTKKMPHSAHWQDGFGNSKSTLLQDNFSARFHVVHRT